MNRGDDFKTNDSHACYISNGEVVQIDPYYVNRDRQKQISSTHIGLKEKVAIFKNYEDIISSIQPTR